MSHHKNDTTTNSGALPESEFILLVYAHLGRSLDANGAAVLRQYLQDPYYVTRFVEICKQDRLIYELFSSGLPQTITESGSMDFVTWQKLAKYEECAPAVQIPQEKQIEQPNQKIQRPSVQIRINRGSLITLGLSMAAMLLFALIIRFVPSKTGIEVATLTDSIKAKWADAVTPMGKGVRLVTGSTSYLLREGIAQIEFDNQAKVTIEAPAEFEIVTGDQVKLNYGRLYAAVPQRAIGFAVQTPTARIIDLGTEFGVKADSEGITELHVIKGKTSIIAGDKNRLCSEVSEGFAKITTGEQGIIKDIPCRHDAFIREINSDKKFVWRGQTAISLADIVGGGNGFGEIHSLIGLDPGTGNYTSSIVGSPRKSENVYNPVADSQFIDGVFVPDGGSDGRIIITSLKNTFQCPNTTGEYTHGIAVYTGDVNLHQISIPQAIFNSHPYADNEILMIHSNAGITLDLQAIRQSVPGLDITHFKALGGLSEAIISKDIPPDVDFWLLVDGQIRYEKTELNHISGGVSFEIELKPQDRFLTLIVTDGSGPKGVSVWANDFFYLIDPQLQTTETSD